MLGDRDFVAGMRSVWLVPWRSARAMLAWVPARSLAGRLDPDNAALDLWASQLPPASPAWRRRGPVAGLDPSCQFADSVHVELGRSRGHPGPPIRAAGRGPNVARGRRRR